MCVLLVGKHEGQCLLLEERGMWDDGGVFYSGGGWVPRCRRKRLEWGLLVKYADVLGTIH